MLVIVGHRNTQCSHPIYLPQKILMLHMNKDIKFDQRLPILKLNFPTNLFQI